MSLNNLLEAARYIEQREQNDEYLKERDVLLESPTHCILQIKKTSPCRLPNPRNHKRIRGTCSPVIEKHEVIGSLQGEVERLNQTLLEMQSRMSSVCEQLVQNARAHFTESFCRQLKEPFRKPFAPLSNVTTNLSLQRSSTPHPTNRKQNGKLCRDGDKVEIGSGKTLISRHVYKQIDWNCYTIATRKLLMAVFPRRTLATHSLTGKASPAFQTKPAKLRLDARKVKDIVMTVVDHCGVREGLVRSCITTKCADENKMYRMRLRKQLNSRHFEDQQNTPPEY